MSTLTVYPDAGDPGSTSCDGMISYSVDPGTDWATARGQTAGTTKTATSTLDILCRAREVNTNPWYIIAKGFFLFDSSALTSAADITAGVISFAAGAGGVSNTGNSGVIKIVAATPASNTTLALGDFDQAGATSFSSMNMTSWVDTNGTYNDFTLDANGRANISKTGISKFAARDYWDIDNVDPAGVGQHSVFCYYADQAGTTTDPKLVVTYTATAIKTFNGIAVASVKTINGVAMASIKTINGTA